MKIVTVLTMISNTILVLFLLFRGWSARLQWLTITSALAVIADFLFFFSSIRFDVWFITIKPLAAHPLLVL